MSLIKLMPVEVVPEFVEIAAWAYPSFDLTTEEAKSKAVEQLQNSYTDDARDLYGLYRDEKLLGGMFLYNFQMNIHSTLINTGGIGLVAVHLLHKKEKVAKELIEFALMHDRDRGAPLTSLYPFRPDFYKKMGFGYGPKISQYRVLPTALPRGSKEFIQFISKEQSQGLLDSYNGFAQRSHGMILRRVEDIERKLFGPEKYVVGYMEQGKIRGYLSYSFDKGDTFVHNSLHVKEMIYDGPEVLAQLFGFLRSQLDQAARIILDVHDSKLHHLFSDPRNSSGNLIPFVYHETNIQGVGLMYRVVDAELLFKLLHNHNFGRQSLVLGLEIVDDFLVDNSKPIIVEFTGGKGAITPDANPDVSISMRIDEFSSLIMGTITFRDLIRYSLAYITEADYLPVVDKLFRVEEEPICMTEF